MSFEGGQIFYTDQQLIGDVNYNQRGLGEDDKLEKAQAELKFMHFIQQMQDKNTFIYRYHLF